ncbi:methylamine utilization protein [Pontibacter sp. JAM-7]|uniref:methylamine utilization protein n=1 Tax=Pontibacter sp. JAM-7 TaxID=3366581 RepID=UPI003AF7D045
MMQADKFCTRLSNGLLGTLLGCISAAAFSANLDVEVKDTARLPLSGAVVYLKAKNAPLLKPMQQVAISQQGKQFVPQMQVVTTGTAIEFPNRDSFRHHVYSFSAPKPFELKLYVGKPKAPIVFDKPGVVVLGCNIHDHMIGWVVVLDTPIFTRSDENGLAQFKDLKPGEYSLHVWHQDQLFGRSTFQLKMQLEQQNQKVTLIMNE